MAIEYCGSGEGFDDSDDELSPQPLQEAMRGGPHRYDRCMEDPRYNPRRVGKRNSRKLKTLQARRDGARRTAAA